MMKKITDFIGDCLVELMVLVTYIIFPLATLTGMIAGLCEKCYNKAIKRNVQ